MPYVDRDAQGRVVGIYAQSQRPEQEYVEGAVELYTPAVPGEVTMQQARRALQAAGKLAAVDVVINAMTEPARTDALIQWEYSGTVRRNQPLVLALAPAIGLDEAGLDALFVQASKL